MSGFRWGIQARARPEGRTGDLRWPGDEMGHSPKYGLARVCAFCYKIASFYCNQTTQAAGKQAGAIEHLERMSQHRSLRAAATMGGKRNVLKRFERIEILKKRGLWKEGNRITGLPKTKPTG